MSWLHALRQRAADLLGTSESDGDLQAEIAHHLELETARQIRDGCPPELARARALARFGDPGAITEATRAERGARPLEGSMQDLDWAVRSLRRSPGFTTLALFTLAVGIGATTVAFTVLNTVLLRPLPYRDADRLVFIQERTRKQTVRPASFPNFVSWRESARAFDGMASAMLPMPRTFSSREPNAEPVRAVSMGVSSRFFAVLGVAPLVGREFTDEENRPSGPPAAMVSYEFWKTQMNGRQPLGLVTLGDTPTPVVGVLPPDFQFVTKADVYFPHETWPSTMRSAHNYTVVARLRPAATLATARADMGALSRTLLELYGTDTDAAGVEMLPLRDYVVKDFRVMLAIVLGAALLVLLIACTNLVSAQLARGWDREREIVVRAALGATRTRLVRQLLLESGILVVAGTVLATLLATVAIRAIKVVGGALLPRLAELRIDGVVLAFVAGIAIVTVMVVGVYPALRLASRDSGLVLRGGRGGSTVRQSVWRALIGFEVALAVMLVVGSALLIGSFRRILDADTGFATHGVVTAAITPQGDDMPRLMAALDALRALPGVSGAEFASNLPLQWGNGSGPVRRITDPADRDFPAMAGFRVVGAGYFGVLKQPILRGRSFVPEDREGAPLVAIVSSGIAEKLWPGEDPVGKPVITNYLWGKPLTVVGVVAEASSWSMPRGAQNEIYVPLAQHPTRIEGQLVAVVRTEGSVESLIPSVRAKLRELLPNAPAQIGTIDERIARSAADRRFAMLALSTFGLVALLLAAVGIYGVIWYIVTTRTHEIGIRMALGATSSMVRREVLRGAAVMAAGGVIAGIGGGAFASRYLQSTLYGVSRLDPRVYAVGAAIALVTTLVAAYVPARRSSRVDPMLAIRGE